MDIVASASMAPGECMFGGASVDLVDTGRQIPNKDGRCYISRELALEIGAAAGLPTLQAFHALEEQLQQLDMENRELGNQLIDAKELLADAEKLRAGIAYTLKQGVVLDTKKLTIALRPIPGQPRPDIDAPLVLDETPVG